MAVETNKGDAIVTAPAQTLTGMVPLGTGRRKRASSLMSAGDSLPSVESSLDEFISRANQTLTDPDQWHAAENAAKQETEQRREADLLRMRAAEQQLLESDAREQSLRRQLDGLQGRLAEAEARAAVAGTGSHDGVIADLKMRLTRADEKLASAEGVAQQAQAKAQQHEARAQQLAHELTAAKSATTAVTTSPYFNEGDSEDRVRTAEAKAQKAIAIARAAQAGLTVSSADISAIESGLVVADFGPQKSSMNWAAIAGAFVVGLGLMFGVSKLMAKPEAVPAPAAAVAQPAPVAPQSLSKPTITPIEEAPPAQPAPVAAQPAPAANAVEKTEASAPVEAKTEPVVEVAPAPAHHSAPAHHAAAPAKKAAPAQAASSSGIADPFGDAPAAKAPAKKPAEKKPASGGAIVDPF